MKYYLGIDASLTGTGLCLIDDEHAIATQVTIKPQDRRGCERLEFVLDFFRTTLNHFPGIHAAAIEGYSFASKFSHAHSQGELGGILRLELYKRHIPFVQVAPMSLKKYITGSGKGEKNKILLEVFRKWGVNCKDDNQADSYALARLCCALYENEKFLKYEGEVFKNLKKLDE